MKDRSTIRGALIAALAMLAMAGRGAAQTPPFTVIDYPNAASSLAWSINNRGEVVGWYIGSDTVHHAFLRSGNQFTSFDFPGASSTEAYGINAQGDIVGFYVAGGVTHGFLRSGNRYTTIDFPGATLSEAAAINTRGDIVGLYVIGGVTRSFLLRGDSFTTVEYPGAATTLANGINDRGDIVGNQTTAGATHAFVLRGDTYTTFDYPTANFTGAYGINQSGDIVGRYRDAANVNHGYLLSGGKFTAFEYPGATFTMGAAISGSGDIAGRYTLDGINHAFVLRRTLQQRYTVKDLGTLGGSASIAYGMNNAGLVAGAASIKTEEQHPFLWQNDRLTDLGTLGGPNAAATNPNGAGVMSVISETAKADPLGEDFCGWGTHRSCLAAFWKEGKLTALPTLGGNNAMAGVINSRGQMAGAAEKATRDANCVAPQALSFAPVIWGPNGNIQELRLPAGDTVGFALSINDRGDAVGSTGNCANALISATGLVYGPRAVLWQNGVPTDLGNFGGSGNALAASINNRGEVVGGASVANGMGNHGFLWTREHGLRDLGTVGEDGSSFPTVINNSGQITGGSCDEEMNCRAFLWENNAMVDLNDLVATHGSLYLVFATWINDSGEIAGQAVDVHTGDLHAFLATPAGVGPAVTATTTKAAVPENIREMLRRRWDPRQGKTGRFGKR